MKIDEVFLKRLERLARFELKKEERMNMREELERMVNSFQDIKKIDITRCQPMISPFLKKNRFQDDTVRESSDYREIQELAPNLKEGRIVVSEKDREKES